MRHHRVPTLHYGPFGALEIPGTPTHDPRDITEPSMLKPEKLLSPPLGTALGTALSGDRSELAPGPAGRAWIEVILSRGNCTAARQDFMKRDFQIGSIYALSSCRAQGGSPYAVDPNHRSRPRR